MSLHYIIDGYNIINHPLFIRRTTKKIQALKNQDILDSRTVLVEFIKINRPCGSSKNKITIVFDGSSGLSTERSGGDNVNIVFSREETADERINLMIEVSDNPKNIVVVSDDKEIRLFARSQGARVMNVETFIKPKELLTKNNVSLKPELTYTQMHKINQELKKIWLE